MVIINSVRDCHVIETGVPVFLVDDRQVILQYFSEITSKQLRMDIINNWVISMVNDMTHTSNPIYYKAHSNTLMVGFALYKRTYTKYPFFYPSGFQYQSTVFSRHTAFEPFICTEDTLSYIAQIPLAFPPGFFSHIIVPTGA